MQIIRRENPKTSLLFWTSHPCHGASDVNAMSQIPEYFCTFDLFFLFMQGNSLQVRNLLLLCKQKDKKKWEEQAQTKDTELRPAPPARTSFKYLQTSECECQLINNAWHCSKFVWEFQGDVASHLLFFCVSSGILPSFHFPTNTAKVSAFL